ncbi:MAG: ABC transporter ATP-binding protein [Zoogloeaceae bacterium]|jgi:iron complex transport system ATP-binding protein|nr:ABC transporter ATP-binding protein [Zoogloeaceae bacterium]
MLAVQNLAFRLARAQAQDWILRDLSFSLTKGELCAVLGPNGIGKSTLLRLLAGALEASGGTILRQGRVGYVPQAVHPALPLSALEMTLLGRAATIRLLAAPGRADYAAARAALARVEALHLAERPFAALSGGERQLVLMARALAAEAEILILDEPAAALDWRHQALLMRLLAELAASGVTVVTSTHAPQHALEFAQRALLLFEAGQYAFGTPAEIMEETALSRLYRLPVRRVDFPAVAGGLAALPVFNPAAVPA